MYNISGDNPTKLYHQAMDDILKDGDEVRPRGKLVRELRPAAIEFKNPFNRVSFLGGRKINPFFQIAESLWILSGRADVDWLTNFNKNMAMFSDDGIYFNAPYGERIRNWGENRARGIKLENPLDQLHDVFLRFMNDKDTRQATIAIGNPSFDNAEYLIDNSGKDIACNLYITFKIRHDKLDMTVFNRSNDLHWGTFGANLCQFTTILEVLYSWLKNSGDERFKNLEIGTYCQLTDSLHIYMDDYGAKSTNDVIDYYNNNEFDDCTFECVNEPRMSMNEEQFNRFVNTFWSITDLFISDAVINDEELNSNISSHFGMLYGMKPYMIDDYWYFAVQSMLLYKYMKHDMYDEAFQLLDHMNTCQWKASMLYFFKNRILKVKDAKIGENTIEDLYYKQVNKFEEELVDKEEYKYLKHYLQL